MINFKILYRFFFRRNCKKYLINVFIHFLRYFNILSTMEFKLILEIYLSNRLVKNRSLLQKNFFRLI